MNHDQEVMVEDVVKRWCVLCVLLLWWDVSRGLKHFETLRLRSNTDVPERVKVPIEGIKTLRSQRGDGWTCTLKTSHCKYVPKIKKKKTQNCVCQSWHRSNKGIQICLIFLPCRWLHWALLPLPLLCFPAFCCYRAPAGETCRFPRRPRPFKSNKCLHELSECSFVTDGCKSRRKEGKKTDGTSLIFYVTQATVGGEIGGWWWAGPGGGRGRVAGEAVWWAGSGRKTTWHRASLHHFRWCVSDRMLANTCYQSGDGNRKLKECNVFTSHVCTSHSWIPLIKSSFTVLFPQAQFFGSVSAVKEKERGKKERDCNLIQPKPDLSRFSQWLSLNLCIDFLELRMRFEGGMKCARFHWKVFPAALPPPPTPPTPSSQTWRSRSVTVCDISG